MFKRDVLGRLSGAALPVAIFALIGAATPAEARHHHHHHAAHAHHARIFFHARHHAAARHSSGHRHAAVAGAGATAAIVVDGASGRVLYAMNEDAPRHPASVTKVMTLYLLFEDLEKGKLNLDSEIEVSAHAAAQAPSKLGLRPGQTIRVEDAIKAIVTKSANDIAVAVAEAVGGSESEFAEMMTRKAHALGMAHTLYRNASGLPNAEQLTTASDLALLGRSIQERFPRYYRYFSLHEFAYRGQHIRNHNHLLGRVEGMDGIKTGYTAASGFNLLTSVKRDGHYIVSVVMGGKTARARDNFMENLIEDHIAEAGAPRAHYARNEEPARREEAETPAAAKVAQAPEPARIEQSKVETAKIEPRHELAPAPVLPIAAVSPAIARPAYVSAAPQPRRDDDAPTASVHKVKAIVADGSTHAAMRGGATTPAMRWSVGANSVAATRAATHFDAPKAQARAKVEAEAEEGVSAKARETSSQSAALRPPPSGWMIQIGATDDEAKATELLSRAKSRRAALLASARPYTEMVRKGHETIYRARFAGLEESRAEAACKALKSSGFACFATRN